MADRANIKITLITAAVLLGILYAPAALALQYSDFPSELQLILDERIAELDAGGGICIAGLVTFSDGAPISDGADVLVNLYHDGLDEPMWIHDGGWFIMGRVGSASYAGPDKGMVLRAFGYDPNDASVTILDGEMTYLEFEMIKTLPENMLQIDGIVYDENNQGAFGNIYTPGHATVSMYFTFANNGPGTYPLMLTQTITNPIPGHGLGGGEYSFQDFGPGEYELMATAEGYDYQTYMITLSEREAAIVHFKIYPNRSIIIDYVYQADGSRDFTTGSLQTGTIEWLNGSGGVDFSRGQVAGGDGQDLSMVQQADILRFEATEPNGLNSFYDSGLVDFDSVLEVTETGYSTDSRLCKVGHVYVARTGEGNYAKFIIQSFKAAIRMFNSVPHFLGSYDEAEFPGYGLWLKQYYPDPYPYDQSNTVCVSKFFGNSDGLDGAKLPYVWQVDDDLSEWSYYLLFKLTFVYDEDNVASAGLSENELTVFQSPDDGVSWDRLHTTRDSLNNTLEVWADRLSWFVIGSVDTEILPRVIYVDDDATDPCDPCDPWWEPGPDDYRGNGASWETAYRYLQDAFESANPGDEIRVAGGTYRPDIYHPFYGWSKDRNATFQLKNGVSIYGGYTGIGALVSDYRNIELYETILSGDLDENDGSNWNGGENSYHVVTGSGTEPNAVLDGFTITRGLADEPGTQPNSHGGGIYNVGGSPTISNCTMTKNYARRGAPMYNGGGSNPNITNCRIIDNWGAIKVGMYNEYSDPTVTGCSFSDNSVQYQGVGTGMYNECSNPVVSDCNFISNGTGMANDNSSPIVTGCIFIDNGCGMGNGESNPIVTNCIFNENVCGMSNYMSNPEVVDCTFSDNSNLTDNYDGTGAGMHNYQSNPVVTDCNFIGNSADYGGGMFNKWYSEPVLTNCTFIGNFARLSGGGICNSREPQDGPTKPVLIGCTFIENSANWYGGAMYNRDSEPNLTDCEFTGNSAIWGGGGMCNDRDCTVSMVNCTFTENSKPIGHSEFGGGGILCLSTSILNMNNCIFTRNSSGYDSSGGGAIHVHDERSLVTLENCRFDTNWAESGGGILNGGQLNLINCTFTENRSWLGWEGGGAIADWGILTIDNCIFSKNISRAVNEEYEHNGYGGFGGALFCSDSQFTITNSIFVDNTSLCDKDIVLDGIYDIIIDTGTGGAVCTFYSSGVIDSCLFTGNSSGIAGGLYLESDYEPERGILLNNCTVVGNSARYYAGGLLLELLVNMDNCIIRDNKAALRGPQIATWGSWDDLKPRISYCDIEGGQEDLFIWDIWGETSIDWGEGNIDADPCFVEAGWWDPNGTPTDPNDDFWVHGDYHLDWPTPCFNAGASGADSAGRTDLDGNPRIRYSRPDLGAYEIFPIDCDIEPDEDVDFADFSHQVDDWQKSGRHELIGSDAESGDDFGYALSANGDVCVVGAPGDDDNGPDSGCVYVFRYSDLAWHEEDKLTAPDGAGGDRFGLSVSVSGDVCVAGTYGDGDQGAAYVFRYNGSEWVFEQKLTSPAGSVADRFGWSVSVSGDFCIVGARWDDENGAGSGAAYVFKYNGSSWLNDDKLTASDGANDDLFGFSVFTNGDTCIVGAPYADGAAAESGGAYVFGDSGEGWIQEAKLIVPDGHQDDWFGVSVCISGDLCVAGASGDDQEGENAGSAYLFRFDPNTSTWPHEQHLLAPDAGQAMRFGASVSVADGAIAIGAYGDDDDGIMSGAAYEFLYDGHNWTSQAKRTAFEPDAWDRFGINVYADSGNVFVSSCDLYERSGAVYVFGSCPELDYNDDCAFDMDDMAIFAEHWLIQLFEPLSIDLNLNNSWMYQNLPSSTCSGLTASVTIIDDQYSNNSYTYEWEIILPNDVSVAPVMTDGGTVDDDFCGLAATDCSEPEGLSDSGQPFTVKVTVTGDDYGNTAQAEAQFGIALLGDVNNDTAVNATDRGIINAFWQAGSAEGFTLRDCDLNCNGAVNATDRSIANAVWRGALGQNQVTNLCPFR